jgi:hypothetical protein
LYQASIVGNHEPPEHLVGHLRLALRDFMSRKKADMQDVWYCHLAAEHPELPA